VESIGLLAASSIVIEAGIPLGATFGSFGMALRFGGSAWGQKAAKALWPRPPLSNARFDPSAISPS